MVSGDFWALSRFWPHAHLSRKRKFELFHALVTSKLIYGLSTLLCTVPQRRLGEKCLGYHDLLFPEVQSVKQANSFKN